MGICRTSGNIKVYLYRVITAEKTYYRARAYYQIERENSAEYSNKMFKEGVMLAEISNQSNYSDFKKKTEQSKAKAFIDSLFPEIKGTFTDGCMTYSKDEAEKLISL